MGFANRQIGTKLCSAHHTGVRITCFVLLEILVKLIGCSPRFILKSHNVYISILIYWIKKPNFPEQKIHQ